MKVPQLIAHRGYSKNFPENTFIAIESALKQGAQYVEFDVQLNKEGQPVVLHDSNLERTTGINRSIFDTSLRELASIPAGEQQKFGDKFTHIRIPTLKDIVRLISAWPDSTAFIEIKRASLGHFNSELVIEKILNTVEPIKNQCVIISFSDKAVAAVQALGAYQTGWIFEPWDKNNESTAKKLSPDYLFTDYKNVPKNTRSFWPGPWKWGLYEINDAQLILQYTRLGADLVETHAIGELLKHPLLTR